MFERRSGSSRPGGSVTFRPTRGPEHKQPLEESVDVGIATQARLAAIIEASPVSDTAKVHAAKNESALFRHCEEFVDLQFAFVLRDIVARTVAALFAGCLSWQDLLHML